MGFTDTTAARMAQVISGWAFAWSVFFLATTAAAFNSEGFPLAPTVSLGTVIASAGVLWAANLRLRSARRDNRRYFAGGGDAPGVMARRRAFEYRVRAARNVLVGVALTLAVVYMVAIGGVRCQSWENCVNAFPGASGISDATRVLAVIFGAFVIATASLLRSHTSETDALEMTIAATERRETDPLESRKSRWE